MLLNHSAIGSKVPPAFELPTFVTTDPDCHPIQVVRCNGIGFTSLRRYLHPQRQKPPGRPITTVFHPVFIGYLSGYLLTFYGHLSYQPLPIYTPSLSGHIPLPPTTTSVLASNPRDANLLSTADVLPLPSHCNARYRLSGIIMLPEGTPALEMSIIRHLHPATFSDPHSPPHSIPPSVARSIRSSRSSHRTSIHDFSDDIIEQEFARQRQLRSMGVLDLLTEEYR
ncbi:uncharacterized protein BT62DRAFT_1079832 [Guyanagaster necrorhizus]|uniref:Uncharacterized protein n=1 Tax=Guyanagaster necrorhizus TaxID=856835 RepID=A0A9P7VJB7_9AGAR|nr:uncharacterized protein BT62DRAFT_1079832 [Guyanagaster necrorhizus MCA 3950]KAG7441662.1 hypothetical protein BT62DRAFT_1079832 [Guyanagaster necrorhizus MCA 3950]